MSTMRFSNAFATGFTTSSLSLLIQTFLRARRWPEPEKVSSQYLEYPSPKKTVVIKCLGKRFWWI
jgi:hypothetical protein